MFNFNKNLKVLSFSHYDLDGIGCQIILSNYFTNITCYNTTYSQEQDLLTKIEAYVNNYDLILITDFTPTLILTELKKITKPIIIIDHHESVLEFANSKENIYINTSMCATKLVYKIFDKLQPMPYLKELVDIINDFDLHLGKDPRSNYYNQIYWSKLYTKKEFINRFKTGNLKLTDEEKQLLLDNKQQIKEYITNDLTGSSLPKNGFITKLPLFLTEISDYLLKTYDWVIFMNIKAEYDVYNISIRCKEELDLNLSEFIKKLKFSNGGGHKSSVGLSFSSYSALQNGLKIIIEAMND